MILIKEINISHDRFHSMPTKKNVKASLVCFWLCLGWFRSTFSFPNAYKGSASQSRVRRMFSIAECADQSPVLDPRYSRFGVCGCGQASQPHYWRGWMIVTLADISAKVLKTKPPCFSLPKRSQKNVSVQSRSSRVLKFHNFNSMTFPDS